MRKCMEVTRITLGDNQYFFFKNGRLKLIYISDEDVDKKDLERIQSGNQRHLCSQKRPYVPVLVKLLIRKVFASQGVTASITQGEVDFIEIYPACSLQEYHENIYREPGGVHKVSLPLHATTSHRM